MEKKVHLLPLMKRQNDLMRNVVLAEENATLAGSLSGRQPHTD